MFVSSFGSRRFGCTIRQFPKTWRQLPSLLFRVFKFPAQRQSLYSLVLFFFLPTKAKRSRKLCDVPQIDPWTTQGQCNRSKEQGAFTHTHTHTMNRVLSKSNDEGNKVLSFDLLLFKNSFFWIFLLVVYSPIIVTPTPDKFTTLQDKYGFQL